MTFGFIQAEKASFPISQMCRVLGLSENGIFAWQDRPACRRQQQDMVYLAHNRTAFALSNGTYGSPRMHRDLVDEGHEIGWHRTARLIRADVASLDNLAAGLRKECLVTVCEREACEPRQEEEQAKPDEYAARPDGLGRGPKPTTFHSARKTGHPRSGLSLIHI